MSISKFFERDIQFLRGFTFDRCPYVISVEVKKTFNVDHTVVTGVVLNKDHQCVDIPPMSMRVGLALEQTLPLTYSDELRALIGSYLRWDSIA
jgi:hypothetical protein